MPLADPAERVWGDDATEKNTIQKTVSNLRRRLRAVGLGERVRIRAEPEHYLLEVV